MRLIPPWLYRQFCAFADALTLPLIKFRFTHTMVTILGLVLGVATAGLIILGHPFWALCVGIVSGICDGVDGRIAAKTNRKSKFGAILDSTLDRYVEFFMFGSLVYYFRGRWPALLAFFAFMGSIMVSYTRARAEGLGYECRSGLTQRLERLILLGLGTIAGLAFKDLDTAWTVALALIALGSHFTAFQRVFLVRKFEKEDLASGTTART